ncbi:MAG: segregation/condensation protein A, partial [Candidatus Krumholzibacteriia bacterium]
MMQPQHDPARADAAAPRPPGGGPESWNLDSLPPELDYFRTSEAYQVELTGFQGPMDLLLYLIEKEQVDIYDIPVARITDQFIRHIEVMQTISLEKAGEFIAMAATLLVIKMRMLMPSHRDEEDEDEEDPRAELVRRLLEYKRFKEAAESLQRHEEERRRYHLRQTRFPYVGELDLEPVLKIGMYDLLSALAGVFDRLQAVHEHRVVREPYTVDEKMSLIEERVGGGAMVHFEELFSGDTIKMEVVVTFIAILELVKRGRLQFLQTEPLGPIWLQRPEAPRDGAGPAGPDATAAAHGAASEEAATGSPAGNEADMTDFTLERDDEDEDVASWGDEDIDDDEDLDDDDIE